MTSSTKSCSAKGNNECNRGFVRLPCHQCNMGSIRCNMCEHSSKSHTASTPSLTSKPRTSLDKDSVRSSFGPSSSCIFCFNGRKACEDCFGLGYVQRICQDCIRNVHRRQGRKASSLPSMHPLGTMIKASAKTATPKTLSRVLQPIKATSLPLDSVSNDSSSTRSSASSISSQDSKRSLRSLIKKWAIPSFFSHASSGQHRSAPSPSCDAA